VKVARLALAATVLAAACTGGGDDDDGDEGAAPATTTTEDTTTTAPVACAGVAAPQPGGAVLTYVVDGRLVTAGDETCLVESGGPATTVQWGPRADRVLLAANRAVLPSGRVIAPFGSQARQVGWSHPEGRSLLAVTADGRLLKHRTIEAEPKDVTFLARHDEAVYHPAGLHILSAGQAEDGSEGVFLATNEGEDAQPVTVAEEARRVYSLAWLPGGASFRFLADHGTFWEVHQVDLDGLAFSTPLTLKEEMVSLMVSPFDGPDLTAVQVGSCRGRTRVEVLGLRDRPSRAGGDELRRRSVAPVGWLDGNALALLARDRGCDGPGDLYVWDGGEPELVAEDVDGAAVRAVLPEPPEPPALGDDPPPA
jgi:hypothetical protein